MLMAHGFLAACLRSFEVLQTAVDVVTTSEVSVSVTIDDNRRLSRHRRVAPRISRRSPRAEQMAILTVVGEKLPGPNRRFFGRAMTRWNRFVPAGLTGRRRGETLHICVHPRANVCHAMTRLHDAFF